MADQASAHADAAPIATPARSHVPAPAVALMAAKVEPPSDEAKLGIIQYVFNIYNLTLIFN